jgi:hypothetical protein
MSTLALILTCLAGDAPAAAPAPVKPEVALFSRAFCVGSDMTEGFGLDKEIGAKTSLADIVDATLLFEHRPAEKRSYPSISIAAQQVKAAVDSNATIVVALDYLVPFVYADVGSDDQRRANVETALATLDTIKVPIILGDVPYLLSASTILNPLITPRMLPKPEALAAINERIAAWAVARQNVAVAPLAAMYANIDAGEGFGVRASAWPASWLSELLLKDRFHTRMHGSIAAWLLGLDALCKLRKDIDPASFDWSAASIYKKVYAAKEAERRAAVALELDSRRMGPNRPPPGPPPPLPTQKDLDEEVRRKARGDAGRGGEDDPKAKKGKDEGER